MTREEAINLIYQEIHDTKIQGEKYAFLKNSCNKECEALTMAIKALEQASVLNKIRAEIIEMDRTVKAVRSDNCCFFTAEEVLEIIDKYKAESEE